MLDVLIGWYMKESLLCRYASIRFEQTIAQSSTSTISIKSAEDGSAVKDKLDGYNFIITDMYVYCTPGTTKVKISPDADNQKSFSLTAYEPARPAINPPITLTSDISLEYTNTDTMDNDVFISFNGFWIPEDKMPELSVLSQVIAEGVYQTETFIAAGLTKLSQLYNLLDLIATDYMGLTTDDVESDTEVTEVTGTSTGAVCRRRG